MGTVVKPQEQVRACWATHCPVGLQVAPRIWDAATPQLDDEQHLQPLQQHPLNGEQVTSEDAGRRVAQNSRQDGPARRGAGSIPARYRIRHTVLADTPWLSPTSSPWILR